MKQYLVSVLLPTLSRTRLLCSVVGVLVLLATYVCVPIEAAESLVRYTGYWFTFSAAVCFAYYCVCQRAILLDKLKGLGKKTLCYLLGGWCIAGLLLFAHANFGPKVMMDDAVLESTARSLHENREVYVSTYGRAIENAFVSFDGYVDKRPWLYPFVVSIVHDITGYRVANAYAANAIAGVLFLGLLLAIGFQIARLRGALLLILLWLSIPLFAQNATGSGLDMVNLLMLSVVCAAAFMYLKQPSYESEGLLSLAGVLLAYSRYESVLFCVCVFAIIVVGWLRCGRIWLSAGSILAAPLLIGLAMQQKFFSASDTLWELHSGTVSPFGLEHLGDNLIRALNFFFHTSDQMGNSLLVAILGFASVFLLLFRLLKHSGNMAAASPTQLVVGLMSVFLFAHLAIILCYHDGTLDRLFASRFALPFYLLLTIQIVLCLEQVSLSKYQWHNAFVLVALFVIGVSMPNHAKAVFTHRNFVVRELNWIERVYRDEAAPRALLVDSYGVYWSLRDVSALSQSMTLLSAGRLAQEVRNGKFPEVFVVDRRQLRMDDGHLVKEPSEFESEFFELELLEQSSFKPFEMTEIYRVTNLKPDFAGDL